MVMFLMHRFNNSVYGIFGWLRDSQFLICHQCFDLWEKRLFFFLNVLQQVFEQSIYTLSQWPQLCMLGAVSLSYFFSQTGYDGCILTNIFMVSVYNEISQEVEFPFTIILGS